MKQFVKRIAYSNVYLDEGAVIYEAGMAVDGDGSPNCYHRISAKGLDALSNAGHPGNWWGLDCHAGVPFIQSVHDPSPGFYVSTTALFNASYAQGDTRRYVDAELVPFIVLPGGMGMGLKLGDLCFCYNVATRDNQYGLYADVGPRNQIGEASIAMAKALSVNPSPRHGGTAGGIMYWVFPGSGKGWQEQSDWFPQADKLFHQWGSMTKLRTFME
jgi:hypothetical protein